MGSVLTKYRSKHGDDAIELTNLVQRTRSRSLIEQEHDFEECILVWLDLTIKYADDWSETLDHARQIINNLKIFDELNDCINFIKMVVNEKVFLVVSHTFAYAICAVKSELRALSSIYIYCDDKVPPVQYKQLEKWAKDNEPLVTGVYVNSTDFLSQLTQDVHDICDHDSVPVTYLSPNMKNMTLKQASPFLAFYLLLHDILLPLPLLTNDTNRKQQILRSCRQYYHGNERRLEEIDHFDQKYTPQTAIDWYLRTAFLFRLIHKSTRTLNLAILFNYHFLFHDINQLIQEKSSSVEMTSAQIFYRAQNLSADDLFRLRLNLFGIVSINRYLDLCRTQEEALSEVSSTSNTLETALYHITLDHSFIPYSNNKVILSIGSLFRIRYVAMELDGIWHIHLDLMKQEEIDEQMRLLIEEIGLIPHPYLSLGLLWEKLKQSTKADRFYRLLVDHLPENDEETALVCNYIGTICRLKCQYKPSLTYHQRALEFYSKKEKSNSLLLVETARTCVQIALVHREMGDSIRAIKYLKLALNHDGKEIHCLLGEIYRNLGQFNLAHQFYQINNVNNHIGICYLYQRMFPQALKYFQQEIEPIPYVNLAIYHHQRREYSPALIFFEKALEIEIDNPLNTAMIHSYLGHLQCDRRQWLLSLRHFEQALDIYKRHLSTNNHPTIALVHDGLGSLYLHKGEYRAAQREFERCLELQLRVLPASHPDIAGTYNNLGGVYNEMGHYDEALMFHYEALAVAAVTLPSDHPDVRLYEHNVTETKRKLS